MQKLPINPFLDFYATPDAMIINPFVFGGGAFDPLSLSPALWLDASDSSTLYDATSGGSLVAADGAIARIEDKSGNARHATQATSGSRPIRKTGIINGKDVSLWSGAGKAIKGSLGSFSAATVFVVFQPASDADEFARVFTQRGSGGPNDFAQTGAWIPIYSAFSTANPRPYGSYASAHSIAVPSNISGGTSVIFTSCHTGTQIQNRINGGTATTASHTLGDTGEEYAVGGSIYGAGGTDDFRGYIAEILVFPTALGTTDRQNVENYLNAKYNIY